MEARRKGQRPFLRSSLAKPEFRGSTNAARDSEWQSLRLRSPAPPLDSAPAPNVSSAARVAADDFCSAPPSLRSPPVPPPARRLRPVAAPSDVAGDNRLLPPPAGRSAGCARQCSVPPDNGWHRRSSQSRAAAASSPAFFVACPATAEPSLLPLPDALPR